MYVYSLVNVCVVCLLASHINNLFSCIPKSPQLIVFLEAITGLPTGLHAEPVTDYEEVYGLVKLDFGGDPYPGRY